MLKNNKESQKKRAFNFSLRVFVCGFWVFFSVSIKILACRDSSKSRFILNLSTGFALAICGFLYRALGFQAKSYKLLA